MLLVKILMRSNFSKKKQRKKKCNVFWSSNFFVCFEFSLLVQFSIFAPIRLIFNKLYFVMYDNFLNQKLYATSIVFNITIVYSSSLIFEEIIHGII